MYQSQGVKKSMIKRFGGSQSGRTAAVFCHIGKMITAAVVGFSPNLIHAAMAMGTKMYTEPMVEPVKVAQVLVRSENSSMIIMGDTLVLRSSFQYMVPSGVNPGNLL